MGEGERVPWPPLQSDTSSSFDPEDRRGQKASALIDAQDSPTSAHEDEFNEESLTPVEVGNDPQAAHEKTCLETQPNLIENLDPAQPA